MLNRTASEDHRPPAGGPGTMLATMTMTNTLSRQWFDSVKVCVFARSYFFSRERPLNHWSALDSQSPHWPSCLSEGLITWTPHTETGAGGLRIQHTDCESLGLPLLVFSLLLLDVPVWSSATTRSLWSLLLGALAIPCVWLSPLTLVGLLMFC